MFPTVPCTVRHKRPRPAGRSPRETGVVKGRCRQTAREGPSGARAFPAAPVPCGVPSPPERQTVEVTVRSRLRAETAAVSG
jgi:hypothetical protein